MKKSLLRHVFKRAELNNVRISLFFFIIEVYRDVVKYKFCYNFNYNDNVEDSDFYTIVDEQSDDFELSRIQFLDMIDELEKMPSYAYRQLIKLFNRSYLDK